MKKIITLLLISYASIANSQRSLSIYSNAEYDEFDKNVNCEFGTTFEVDNLPNSYFQVGWRDFFYIDRGWSDDIHGENAFSLNLFARLNTCDDGVCIECRYCSSEYLSEEYKPTEWDKYLKKEINSLPFGFSYIHFVAYNGDDIKIYVSRYGNFSHKYSFSIPLNSSKYPRTVDYYNWLNTHQIKKVRFSSGRSRNLDFDIPLTKKYLFKDVISMIENFREEIKQKYSN